jgi:glycosyltransferase involved in cell wall biosynthesis
MRVLLITDWMRGAGGAERYVATLRDGLRAAGNEVRLLTSTAGSAANGSAEYRAYGTEHVAAQAVLQIVNPFAVVAVRSALQEFQPDVVFLNMLEYHLSPAILYQVSRVPSVLSITDYKCVCPVGSKLLPNERLCEQPAGLVCWRSGCVSLPQWLRDQPRYALFRAGRRRVDRVLACSRWVQAELARNGIEAEVLTLPVPAPGADFRRAPSSEPLFVYCGRLDRNKGLELLLRAFVRLRQCAPTARLRVVGTGPDESLLRRSVEKLGLSDAVGFRGWVAPDEVERELTDGWALVVPSLWAEPLGLVALEAIVRGLPVIASASGGLGEVVEHGVTGLLFQNGVEDELVGHLTAVARGQAFPTHDLPHDVVARAREAHGIRRHINRMQEIFQDVVHSAGAAAKVSRPPVDATRSGPL